MSPHTRNPLSNPLSQSPLMAPFSGNSSSSSSEIQRLREELATNRAKLASWEEGIAQARTACEAWRREADDANRKFKLSEQTKEEFAVKIAAQQKEMEELKTGGLGPYVQALHPHSDLENLPLHTLKALQSQLRQDLESVEKWRWGGEECGKAVHHPPGMGEKASSAYPGHVLSPELSGSPCLLWLDDDNLLVQILRRSSFFLTASPLLWLSPFPPSLSLLVDVGVA
ncbi:putative E3 ubiquitin-protein ligase UNKL isoform X4 [Penaeus vannamei]|uniref:Putative E3 ubiquitin-protein ligase UNKL isoform X4 n=1 Tax=Penaeus vannamei TaxID=6689 RepID=A0A423TJF3_PENVA|nr:putative E3 ubiquitin-protein ligase UNKL isoform X4 [Penaeus vannamei]